MLVFKYKFRFFILLRFLTRLPFKVKIEMIGPFLVATNCSLSVKELSENTLVAYAVNL